MDESKPFYPIRIEGKGINDKLNFTYTILNKDGGFESEEEVTIYLLEKKESLKGYGCIQLIIEEDTYDVHSVRYF